MPRQDTSSVTPKIPSLPISFRAAEPLLAALDGFGLTPSEVNRTVWKGALDAEYRTGPAPGATLSLKNVMEGKITPIWNVIGVINGTNPDETLVIGNHRDTWMIGMSLAWATRNKRGADNPRWNRGSQLRVCHPRRADQGVQKVDRWWLEAQAEHVSPNFLTSRPKWAALTSQSVLASWDAEEYGLIGSVEWVEEHVDWLKDTAIAYVNIDVAVSGPRPGFAATPELHEIGSSLLKKVVHPNFGGFNRSLYDAWQDSTGGSIEVLGSGSDFTAFLHNGIGAVCPPP